MEFKKDEDPPDRELVLHYLDQVVDAYKESLKNANRTFLLLSILSFIVIALSSGLASVSQIISIFGLAFTIPAWLILMSGAYFVSLLFMYFTTTMTFSSHQRDVVYFLYKDIGYKEEHFYATEYEKVRLNIEYIANFASIMLDILNYGRLAAIAIIPILLLSFLLLLILPLIAQIFAMYKLIVLFSWTWWIILTVIILISIDIACFLVLFSTRKVKRKS